MRSFIGWSKGEIVLNQHLRQYTVGKEVTRESEKEGIGKVREWGKLDVEKLMKRLLESRYITG